MATNSVMTVIYTGEPDEVHQLGQEGQEVLFGRDDEVCQVVIWSAINSTSLSRVAGRIWRMEGQLWLRNLSTSHELVLHTGDGPPEPPLPPASGDPWDPGPARSIPVGEVLVVGPDGCEVLVRQQPVEPFERPLAGLDEVTVRLPPVPDRLRQVAEALCAPLVAGGQLPASYAEVGRALGTSSVKRVRLLVGELCETYLAEAPILADHVARRRLEDRADQEGQVAAPPSRLLGGVWTFDATDDEEETRRRRRSLNLPDYYEVAHLLVRHHLVGPGGAGPGRSGQHRAG